MPDNDNRYIKEFGRVDEAAIYRDAWRIADPGAANPVAVAATLAAASSALLHDNGTDYVKKHPALRVMAGQLSSLYNVSSLGADLEDYDRVKDVVDGKPGTCLLCTAPLYKSHDVTPQCPRWRDAERPHRR
jgi:hypothetical protein